MVLAIFLELLGMREGRLMEWCVVGRGCVGEAELGAGRGKSLMWKRLIYVVDRI